jgi:hypothetical protein
MNTTRDPFPLGARVRVLPSAGREDVCGKSGTVYAPPNAEDPTCSVRLDGHDAPMVFPIEMLEVIIDESSARLKRVLDSTDFTTGEKAAIRWAFCLCGDLDAKMFNFIHVAVSSPTTLKRLELSFPEEVQGYLALRAARTSARASLATRLGSYGLQVPRDGSGVRIR